MNIPATSTVRPSAAIGSASGVIAWLCYGSLELCGMVILPRLTKPGYDYRPYAAGISAMVLVIYAVIGAIAGAASGILWQKLRPDSRPDAPRVLRAISTAGIATALLGNVLLLGSKSPYSPIILTISLILVIAACIRSIIGGEAAHGSDPFTAAWLPSAVYLGCHWVAEWLGNGATPAGRIRVYGVVLIAVLGGIAFFAGRTRLAGSGGVPGKAMATTGALAIACCIGSGAMRPSVYVAPAGSQPAAGKPNVLLISLDTVRADHLSVYGYERKTTPHLERFAAESVVFTRAFATSDMTLPSHASMFTGLYASQHGSHFSRRHRMGAPLDSRFPTLAEILQGSGYWTGGVVANSGYLSVAFGLHRGFGYWDQRMPAVAMAPTPQAYLRGRLRDLAVRFIPTGALDRVSRSAREINDAAMTALAERPRDGRPFFLFLNYMDAHVPYIPPAPYDTMFPGKDDGFTESRYMSAYLDVIAREHDVRPRDQAHLVSQYDGGIAYLDAQLAELFNQLKSAGLYENTLIIVTSDHGEALGERRCMDHGGMSLHEEQIRVPLIIRFPKGQGSARVAEPVSGVDILPTVLNVAGYPVPRNVAGLSLTEAVPEGREIISESFPGGRAYFTNPSRFDRIQRSIISASRKLIAPSPGKAELYDLRRDPDESTNLFNLDEPASVEVAERLIAWTKAIGRRSRGPVRIDRETMERLRSLGYVGQ